MTDSSTAAVSILKANRYLVLATPDDTNGVWVAPLAFVVLNDGRFAFYSAKDARHSKPGRVAGVVFDSRASSDEADGLQFEAELEEVSPAELGDLLPQYYERMFHDPKEREEWRMPEESFLGDAPQRLYTLKVTSAWVLDPESPKIDRRRSVPVERLQIWQ